ncbi:TPA: hypothetical protein ACGSTL_001207 [Vibrio parahaemolyticus]|uniref:hypothetical protein n=1 Tax=Vibrio campbellii TaxID=680 RepID=UPI001F0861ED|nr:hypothetical protein [Vibrio campbellii]UMM06626.1 hypothetical protein MKR81_27145 [Vibrio campbellii]
MKLKKILMATVLSLVPILSNASEVFDNGQHCKPEKGTPTIISDILYDLEHGVIEVHLMTGTTFKGFRTFENKRENGVESHNFEVHDLERSMGSSIQEYRLYFVKGKPRLSAVTYETSKERRHLRDVLLDSALVCSAYQKQL